MADRQSAVSHVIGYMEEDTCKWARDQRHQPNGGEREKRTWLCLIHDVELLSTRSEVVECPSKIVVLGTFGIFGNEVTNPVLRQTTTISRGLTDHVSSAMHRYTVKGSQDKTGITCTPI